uniref:Uncharacterized protein n=2 Tax=gambiae species complex TaxID=44542 RepID=A0A8W7PAZ0_ANOCL
MEWVFGGGTVWCLMMRPRSAGKTASNRIGKEKAAAPDISFRLINNLNIRKGSRTGNSGNHLEFQVLTQIQYVP